MSQRRSREQNEINDPSDDSLMKSLSKGSNSEESKKAFRLLFDRHGGLVLGYCTRFLVDRSLAEDVSQEVWMKVIQNAAKYESRNQLRPWLLTVARNTSLNVLRSRKAFSSFESNDDESSALDADLQQNGDKLESMIATGQMRAIKDVMDALPAAQRTSLSLLLIEELSYEEIAKAMDLTIGAVKTHIHRGRKTLESEIKARGLT